MTELATLPAVAETDEILDKLERDGGVIIGDFADADTLDGLEHDLRPQLDQQSSGRDAFSGHQTRRLGALFKRTRHMVPLARQPHFRSAAHHYLVRPSEERAANGENVAVPNYQIGVTQAIEIHPGQGGQPLHRDDGVWQWRHTEGGDYQQARVQIMLALTDFTAENGATMVVPGSHTWGDDRYPTPDDAIPAVMKRASALLWLGGLYHGGGTNHTDSYRTGITMTFDLGYLRQEENQYLSIPIETVLSYDEDIRGLLGWAFSPPNVGFIEVDGQMADPVLLLRDDIDIDNITTAMNADRLFETAARPQATAD